MKYEVELVMTEIDNYLVSETVIDRHLMRPLAYRLFIQKTELHSVY
jgi:hypothetical protein